jgi:hypothetical protein
VNAGLVDLSQLKAAGVEARSWSPAAIEGLVQAARRKGGWLIFFTHDVSEAPSPYGATPEMLAHALRTVQAAGIEVLPVKHALARLTFG